ncbi:MAG: ABC transporter ATP-binding protein [Oscillospiraceae bacterium]|nr:ABC transporter ATP-binding protein [Oscillospiraceae bacterium]
MDENKEITLQTQDAAGAKVRQKGVWKRFLHTCRAANLPYGLLLLYILLTVAEGFVLVRIPQVNSNFFNGDVTPSSVAMFIGMELLSLVITQGMLYLNHVIRFRTNRNLRSVLWGKILKLKPAYFDRVTASTLISRITVDADALNAFVLDVVLEAGTQIYYLVMTILAMSALSIKAGLYLLAFAPLTILLSFVLGRISMKFQNAAKFKLSNLTEYLSELISTLPLLKAFNMQGYEAKRGKKVIDDYYDANKRIIFLDVISEIVGAVKGILPEIVIILMGIRMLQNNTVDGTGWYTFYLYAGTFIGFFGTLGSIWTHSKSIQGELNKISDVICEEEEGVNTYADQIAADGDILFDGVSFAYEEDPILNNVSLTIPGGKVTAVVGYSGSGKTTVAKLLERIYEPDQGRILCGGKVIGDGDVRAWRSDIAFVMQDTPLLSGTIRDNLLYGIHREVREEEIDEAVKLVKLDGFLAETPEGLDREVGQFGEQLSGGQRQKIAIAGAILSGARLLILDEPTASLDISATHEIVQTIFSLKGKRTVLLVTHDREAVKAADHIIVVESDHSFHEGDDQTVRLASPFYRHMMTREAQQA